MRRRIDRWKKAALWFLTALLVSAALVALAGKATQPEWEEYPETLLEPARQAGLWISGNDGWSQRPGRAAKFAEMLAMQSVWILLTGWTFRTFPQGRTGTLLRRILLPSALVFGYGVLITVVWFWNGNRLPQLNLRFLLNMGFIFLVWYLSLACLNLAAEQVPKRPPLSVGTDILRRTAQLLAYGIVPVWYVWFNRSQILYQYGWTPYFRSLSVWILTRLPLLLILSAIMAFLAAAVVLNFVRWILSAKKEDEEALYGAKECSRLIVFVTPENILFGANIQLSWLGFLLVNGNVTAKTRTMAVFQQGENLVSSLHQYTAGAICGDSFTEKICLLRRDDKWKPAWTAAQENRIAQFLKSMEAQGFRIVIDQHVRSMNKSMEQRVPEQVLYSPYPVRVSSARNIPMELIGEYGCQQAARAVYLEMNRFLKSEKAGPFLNSSAERLCMGEGSVAQFYNLLKMAEYCVHRRALYELSEGERSRTGSGQELKSVAFGTWVSMQRLSKSERRDEDQAPGLAQQVQILRRMAAKHEAGASNRTTVSYNEICEVMVSLRNRFVGHGTMIYSIQGNLLYPMAEAVFHILKVYRKKPHELTTRQVLLPGKTEHPVKAVWKKRGKLYLFNGIDGQGCRDYLNYETGNFLTLEPGGEKELAKAPVLPCREQSGDVPVMEQARSRRELDEKQQAAKKAFLHKYRRAFLLETIADADTNTRLMADIQQNCVTKEYFKREYAGAILGVEPDGRDLHDFLLELGSRRVVHLMTGAGWDRWNQFWHAPMNSNIGYLLYMMASGEWIPRAPVKIGILGPSETPLVNKAPWIRSLEIQRFDSYPALLSWAGNAPVHQGGLNQGNRKRLKDLSDFMERETAYQRVLSELGCASPLTGGSIYVAGFFKNVFDYEDASTSAMALFDFIEFIMQSVHYTLLELSGIPVSENSVNPDLKTAGRFIMEHAREGSELHRRLHSRTIRIPDRCQALHRQLREYLPLEISGSEMDFPGLTNILRLLRNISRAHGVIREEHVGVLWSLLLYYAVMCAMFLDLEHFELYVAEAEQEIWAGYSEGYEDGYIRVKEYFALDKNVPCPLWEYAKGRRYYINYFYGHYVIPDIIGQEPAEEDEP